MASPALSHHILVIEDDPDTAAIIEMTLRTYHYQAQLAYAGEAGLSAAQQRRPDLVVLDVNLPDIDGFEVCRRLRADPRLAHTPVLFLSAQSRTEDKITALHAGADDYLTKPFHITELVLRVGALLRRAGPPASEASDGLRLCLLGPVLVERNSAPLAGFESQKALALLCYLSVMNKPVTRDQLAGMFWGDQPQTRARGNLRRVIHNLNTLFPGNLQAERDQVSFQRAANPKTGAAAVWLDLAAFDNLAANGDADSLTAAVELWRGEFMEGLRLESEPEFEMWLADQRRWRQSQLTYALDVLLRLHTAQNDAAAAIAIALRLLALDPLREETHRALMSLYARSGQRAKALAQYQTCRRALAEEFKVEPEPETTELYKQILAGELAAPRPPAPAGNLPAPLTPFVGRDSELAAIAKRLLNPECRLLTLVGLGGMGKTRLAIQAAMEARPRFSAGVFFAPYGSAAARLGLLLRLAEALGLPILKGKEISEQLRRYLADKEMLLVLDGVERLLAEAEALTPLLENAPRLKLLVTSRERLNLPGEWVLEIGGLETPAAPASPEQLAASGAVRLFLESALRTRPDLKLNEADYAGALRICQKVGGMPLAIEMAAGWLRTLSFGEVADEIGRNIDFLKTFMPDVPDRHHSLRAVFDQSWSQLSEAEQRALRNLSVFRGGFRRESAEQVAGASLLTLTGLIDKALVYRRPPPGSGYDLHELVRQYAAEKLEESARRRELRDRHVAYYAAFLNTRASQLQTGNQKAALAEIAEELDNVRHAWNWLVDHPNPSFTGQMLESLFHFYDMQSHFHEGYAAFTSMLAGLDLIRLREPQPAAENVEAGVVAGKLLARLGWFAFHLGRHTQAKDQLCEALALLRRLDASRATLFCLNYLGAVHRHLGEYAEAQTRLAEALTLCRAIGDRYGESIALNILGQVDWLRGAYASAQQTLSEALQLKREIGDRWGMTYSLTYLGRVAEAIQNYAEAEQLYRESLLIYDELGDRRGLAVSMQHLGVVAGRMSDYPTARAHLQEAVDIFRDLAQPRNAVDCLNQLGQVYQALGDEQAALAHFGQALELAAQVSE